MNTNQEGFFKRNFPLVVILLIPIAIAINVVGGTMTSALKLPIALDMIGVILVGALAGPIPAGITGILTNLINGIFDPSWIPYAIPAFFIGVSAGLLSKYNMMNKIWKVIISGLVIALTAIIFAVPIKVFVFGGVDGGGSSMLAAGLMATGRGILQSVLSVNIVTESVGKMFSIFVAYFIIKAIPERSLVKYKYGSNFIKEK